MTAKNPNAVYICVNFGEAFCPEQIMSRAACINGDINEILNKFHTFCYEKYKFVYVYKVASTALGNRKKQILFFRKIADIYSLLGNIENISW